MYEPARVVKALDSTVQVDVRADLDVEATRDPVTKLVTVSEVKEDVDLIIFQRPLSQAMYAAIVQAKKQGIATIVEMDDDLERVHPQNVAWTRMQPKYSPTSNYEWAKKAALEADALVVSTPTLTRFKPSGPYFVLRNCVPESIFSMARMTPRTKMTVGWTGTIQTHPQDLQVTRGAVGKALDDFDTRFYVVGDGEGVERSLQLSPGQEFQASGWTPLDQYYQTILDNIDIGIVPLELSDFNQAKSWLKLLEFSALGIPAIASGTRENVLLSMEGVGTIATSPRDWLRQLLRLLEIPEHWDVLSARSRDIVREKFTYEANAASWLRAWEDTILLRKASK